MNEGNRAAFSSSKDWFLNYINHGGPEPEVTGENYQGARNALDTVLSESRRTLGRLGSLRRIIAGVQIASRDGMSERECSDVVRVFRGYPPRYLRWGIVGEYTDSVVGNRVATVSLLGLLREGVGGRRPRRG